MLEIKIANYTLVIAMLMLMTTFCLSIQSLNKSNDLNQYPPALANVEYKLIYR